MTRDPYIWSKPAAVSIAPTPNPSSSVESYANSPPIKTTEFFSNPETIFIKVDLVAKFPWNFCFSRNAAFLAALVPDSFSIVGSLGNCFSLPEASIFSNNFRWTSLAIGVKPIITYPFAFLNFCIIFDILPGILIKVPGSNTIFPCIPFAVDNIHHKDESS